jgi:hypothetical protein
MTRMHSSGNWRSYMPETTVEEVAARVREFYSEA